MIHIQQESGSRTEIKSTVDLVQLMSKIDDPIFKEAALASHARAGSALLTDSEIQVLLVPIVICGHRMTLRLPASCKINQLTTDALRNITGYAKELHCQLLQAEIPGDSFGELSTNLPPGFFASSLVLNGTIDTAFSGEATGITDAIDQFTRLDLTDSSIVKRICELELAQRWQYPGLTVSDSDNFTSIYNDYKFLAEGQKAGRIKAIAHKTNWQSAFIFAYINDSRKSILGGYIWVDPAFRKRNLGRTLIKAALNDQSLNGYTLTGICSAANIRSLTTMLRMGMKVNNVMIHRLVPQSFEHATCKVSALE